MQSVAYGHFKKPLGEIKLFDVITHVNGRQCKGGASIYGFEQDTIQLGDVTLTINRSASLARPVKLLEEGLCCPVR